MSKMRFELNEAGVRELLKSSGMQDVLKSYAGSIASRAGAGYDVHVGPNRANVSVETSTREAVQDNYENNTLLKSMG